MPYTHANGIKIYYEFHPSSNAKESTPLLLIMGLGLNSVSWQKNLPVLTATHNVIVFDNRGTGRTSKLDQPYNLPQMAADSIAVLDALKVRRAHVFGFSLGSLIAQEVALLYPHRVRSLILGASSPGSFYHVPPDPQITQVMLWRGWVNPVEAAELGIPVIYSPAFIRDYFDEIRADTARRLKYPTPPYAYRRQSEAVLYHDTYYRLPRLAMPTLVLTGDADRLVVPENSYRLAKRIPFATLRVLRGAGHYFTSEQPELTAFHIKEFLAHAIQRQTKAG